MDRTTMRIAAGFALLLAAASASAAQQLPDFTGIVEKNAPAVVHVEADYDGNSAARQMQMQSPQEFPPGMPEIFRHFFGQPGMPQPGEGEHTSVGSGFIISSDGYVLTNDHVVDHADKVTVRLQDHRTLTAKVVGTDKTYDIALLKLDTTGLPTVTLGDSKQLKAGQWVLAIGSPFGFDYTVTQGIVSAVGRNLGSSDQPYTSFIQTDVPINRGNSGGPLFNLDGQVVGINSQIYSNTGGYMGVAFSIPIDVAMDAVRQIKDHGYVSRGMIGVHIQGVDADKAKALGLKRAVGALVAEVDDGSPGAKAGLQVGDLIQSYNGREVIGAGDLPPMVAATKPGTTVPVQILRDGKQQTVDVKIGELPRNKASGPGAKTASVHDHPLGVTVDDLSADQREALGLGKGEGVVISDITGRQAMRAGLRPGTVILMVGQHHVGSASAFKALTRNLKPGQTVMLLVRDRDGDAGFVTVTVPAGD
ncbi:MAG TPA: Do family serine endopeptidase [Rhodanobacteraceae bacterium]|nr:Do family serine endopeptidase [Rhodanobacteraceae bacterium]